MKAKHQKIKMGKCHLTSKDCCIFSLPLPHSFGPHTHTHTYTHTHTHTHTHFRKIARKLCPKWNNG